MTKMASQMTVISVHRASEGVDVFCMKVSLLEVHGWSFFNIYKLTGNKKTKEN